MPLQPGITLGPYTVTAKIGEGGMGEVYRARDTKLDRDVALKLLPQAFTQEHPAPTLAVTGRTRWLWPAVATAMALGAAIALWAPWRADPEAVQTRLRTCRLAPL